MYVLSHSFVLVTIYYKCKNLVIIFFKLIYGNVFPLSLINLSNLLPFSLANFIWKSKVLSKVKTFAWLVANKKVNPNDMKQMRRPYKALSPNYCILYNGSG